MSILFTVLGVVACIAGYALYRAFKWFDEQGGAL